MRELGRFANRRYWAWFSLVLLFFLLSGAIVATYWWNHYSEDLVGKHRPQQSNPVKVYGFSKDDVKRIIRSIGTACAVIQLGTAFASLRALFSAHTRQRLVAMDLRGVLLGAQNPCNKDAYIGCLPGRCREQVIYFATLVCILWSISKDCIHQNSLEEKNVVFFLHSSVLRMILTELCGQGCGW